MTGSAKRFALPSLRGPFAVGIGTVILGLSGYVFLALTPRMVSPADYAALASLYLLVALLGPGLFMPVEQEATRVVSKRLALGQGPRGVIGQLVRLDVALLGLAALMLVAFEPILVAQVFNGRTGLWFALLASVIGYGGASVVRGILAARRQFGTFGLVLGTDGMVRMVPCLCLAVAGVTAALPYGLALGLGPIASLLVAVGFVRGSDAGPRLPWRELISGTAWLVFAWGVSLALANIAPVLVTAMLDTDPGRAGVFAFVFVLARIPLFVLFALQPILLPTLAAAAASRDVAALARGVRQALIFVLALGAAALLTTALIAGLLVDILFETGPAPSAVTVTLLAAGTVLAMVVQVLQPALLAVASHRVIAAAWLSGAVCFGLAFALPVDPIVAATIAQLVAGAVTVAMMGVALRPHLVTRRVAVPGGPRPGVTERTP